MEVDEEIKLLEKENSIGDRPIDNNNNSHNNDEEQQHLLLINNDNNINLNNNNNKENYMENLDINTNNNDEDKSTDCKNKSTIQEMNNEKGDNCVVVSAAAAAAAADVAADVADDDVVVMTDNNDKLSLNRNINNILCNNCDDDDVVVNYSNDINIKSNSQISNKKDATTVGVDPPTELSFERIPENQEQQRKRFEIEKSLKNSRTTLEEWQEYAMSDYGLISDDLRRRVWPLLVGIDPNTVEAAPKLDDLKLHPEYNQVILDVNRSLKRFPPGIPYEQRIALQDQLTVLILRVIIKYPHLKYYQGYHDVAVTFLLVVGDEIAFHVMEILSTNHLVECMQETMEPTQRRLMFLYPIIRGENKLLCEYLERSTVGTLFALPWYLTWFGHSLNSYQAVVRLYDYFLATPYLLPLYVTAAIVLYREDDIFKEDCDMASLHCVLSQLPEDLPFEYLLKKSDELYKKYPPDVVELEVQQMIIKEQKQRKIDEEMAIKRRRQLQLQRSTSKANGKSSLIIKYIPNVLLTKRSVYVTTAFSIIVGICAYYYRTHIFPVGLS